MTELPLSPAAQQWACVILMWVGFGTVAGLLATAIAPFRRAVGPFLVLIAGIVGSMIGLFVLGWFFPERPLNPISLLGLVASAFGAFAILLAYRLGGVWFVPPEKPVHRDDA